MRVEKECMYKHEKHQTEPSFGIIAFDCQVTVSVGRGSPSLCISTPPHLPPTSLSAFSEPFVNAVCCQKQAIQSHDCRQTGRSKRQAGTGYLLCESSEEAWGWLILNETEASKQV